MVPNGHRVRPLLLLLAASVALLTTVQCLSLFASANPEMPAFAALRYSPAIHTREEVSERGVDVSTDAHRKYASVVVESAATADQAEFVEGADAEVSPLRRTLHRRVSPSSPDDAFPSASR